MAFPGGSAVGDALAAFLSFLLLACFQAPGRIAADTKYDLLADPVGFLRRSLHLWTDLSFAGQVQNQSYGYLFPQGPFFALGHLAGLPTWFTERLWWAVVLTTAFTGTVRLAAALGVRGRGARVVGGLAYALAPRMIADLGAISAEVWPVALAPWVLLPVVLALDGRMTPRRAGAGAALALALMGAVNAVATAWACLPAVLWWLTHRPGRTWARLTAWWLPLSALVCLWWAVPLVLLGQVAPPFLDYIESAAVTTRWAGLAEVVRGTGSWVPFVSGERAAGVALTSTPALVLATAVVAAAGLAGLLAARLPQRGRLLLMAGVGVAAMSAAWVGPGAAGLVDGLAGTGLRELLDGPLAALRNVHKTDPLIRLPIALGLAAGTSRVLARARAAEGSVWRAAARPERNRAVAAAMVVGVAFGAVLAPVWLGRLAPTGTHEEVPAYWRQTADWLATRAVAANPGPAVAADTGLDPGAPDPSATGRALVLPGASFAEQVWGTTRDEPMQALARTPWAVRDAVPLQPAPAVRALDAVQRDLADGRESPGLAATLAALGVSHLVVRNDLDPAAGAPRPILVHRTLDSAPGLTRVAAFGAEVGRPDRPSQGPDRPAVVTDDGLSPAYPAVEIYQVGARLGSDGKAPGPPVTATAPYLVDVARLPVVAGGPEVQARLDDLAAARLAPRSPLPRTTRLLADDAARAGLTPSGGTPGGGVVLSDTPVDREADMGRVDHGVSGIRAAGDPRATLGTVADHAAGVGDPAHPGGADAASDAGAGRTVARWSGGRLSASSSASDADQPGAVRPGSSPAAAVDGDPATAWRSGGVDGAFGQWLRVDLDAPADRMLLTLRLPAESTGPAVTSIDVRTDQGSTTAHPAPGVPTSIALPPGPTSWIRIEATGTADGSRGVRFEIAELGLRSGERPIEIRRDTVLPLVAPGTPVAGWVLGQDFGGRDACVSGARTEDGPAGASEGVAAVPCADGLAIEPEEPRRMARVLDSPQPVQVVPELLLRPRPSGALADLLRGDRETRARQVGASLADGHAPLVADPRGAPYAAVDGDRSTSWYADPADPAPLLRLRLPEPTTVSSLQLWPARSASPAAPRIVTVDTGRRTTTVDLSTLPERPDGSRVVNFPATRTDRLSVRIDAAEPVLAESGSLPGAGIAEVWVRDPSGARVGALPAANTEPVTVPCSAGPTVTAGGRTVRLSLSADRSALARGGPVRATVCGDATLALPRGAGRVEIDPGPAFSVETAALTVKAPAAPGSAAVPPAAATALGTVSQPTRAVAVTRWDPAGRTMRVPASARDRVLVVPQSINGGWRVSARPAAGGDPVEGVRMVAVDGWQQGVVLPAAMTDLVVTWDYPSDRLYRWALLTGPVALVVVLVLWLVRGADRAGSAARTWRVPAAAGLAGVAVFAGLVGGWAGLGVTLAATAATWAAGRRWAGDVVRRWTLVAAAGALLLGGMLLSFAPWPSPLYAGDGWGPQLATFVGLVLLGVVGVGWVGSERRNSLDAVRFPVTPPRRPAGPR